VPPDPRIYVSRLLADLCFFQTLRVERMPSRGFDLSREKYWRIALVDSAEMYNTSEEKRPFVLGTDDNIKHGEYR